MSRPQWSEADNAALLAVSVGMDAESALHADTEKAYAEALATDSRSSGWLCRR